MVNTRNFAISKLLSSIFYRSSISYMWKKIMPTDSVLTIHCGDIISQSPYGAFCEFVIKTLAKGYLSALHNDIDGEMVMKHFPINDLHKDNWWVKQ